MEYNRKIVSDNILKLMKENNITQNGLAEIAGSHQGRISKCLQCDGDFTLQQLVAIADRFQISLDDLMGRKENILSNEITLKDFCKTINQIANIEGVRFADIQNTEFHPPFTYSETLENHRTIYKGFYFSNMLDDVPFTYNKGNVLINDFIETLLNLLNLKKRGDLSSEDYDYLIEKRILSLPDETLNSLVQLSRIPEELPFN